MTLPMPPCFDCGKKLEKGNIWIVTNETMKTKPKYDYRLSETDPKFFLKNPETKKGTITVCDKCDNIRFEKEQAEKKEARLDGKIDWEWNKLPKTKRKALAIKAGVEEEIAHKMSQKQDWQDVCYGSSMICSLNAHKVLEYMTREKIIYE